MVAVAVAPSLQRFRLKGGTMANLRHVAIEDDDPVKRRGNDERDDRYPYGGDRTRKKKPTPRPAGSRARTSAASSSSPAVKSIAVKRRATARPRTVK
jgi:hypothetical protein